MIETYQEYAERKAKETNKPAPKKKTPEKPDSELGIKINKD